MGRFLNADALASTGQGIIGNNMFAYCLNNPILYADSTGAYAHTVNPNAHCFEANGASGGGGLLVTIGLLEAISGTVSGVCSWLDDQKKAITEKLSKSLAIAVPRDYRTDYEEHHLVARRSPNAAQAAAILNDILPGGVEDPQNKVWVKTSVHRRLHTNLYYTFANQLVISAYLQAGTDRQQQYDNVVQALITLRVFVESLNAFSIN